MAGNQEIFQKAMNQGHSAAWDEDWEKALTFYSQALQEFPDNSMALNNLGLAMFELKRYDKALRCYQKAAKISPNDPLPTEKMARIFERLGQTVEAMRASVQAAELYLQARDAEKAIENYQKAISLQPENAQVRNRLGLIYERLKQTDKAVKEFLASASVLQRSGDLLKAAQTVDHCLQLAPENPEAVKAKTLLQKKQLLPAPEADRVTAPPTKLMEQVKKMEAKEEVVTTKSSDPISEAKQKALVQLASLLFDQVDENATTTTESDSTQKIAIFKRNNKKPIDFAGIILHLSQAINLQTHGKEDDAASELAKSVEMGLNHPAAYFILGMLLSSKDSSSALKYLSHSIRDPDFSLSTFLLMGQVHRKSGNMKEAATGYLRALNLADAQTVPPGQIKDLNHVYEPIIETHANLTDKEKLAQVCNVIASQIIRPDWKEYMQMARQQMPAQPAGSPPLALAEVLLATSSSMVIETIGVIRKLAEQGKQDSAMEEAYYALQSAPTYLPLHTQIGELLVKNNAIPDAVAKFILIAKLYHLRGETAQAISLLNNVVSLSPMDLSVRSFLIDLLITQGQIDDAISQSIEMAQNYEFLADFDKARQIYTDTLRITRQSTKNREWSLKLLYKIADIDQQRLEWHQAVRVFEQIRTLEPEDVDARVQLVELNFRLGKSNIALTEAEGFVTLLENSGKLSVAVDFLQRLIQGWPDVLDLRRSLAELYARENQIQQAIEQFDIIASALMDSGDTNSTIGIIERIIALNPPNMADYQAAIAKLKST